MQDKVKVAIRFVIVVVILTLVITTICLLMLKYAVEGESNMPFELSQIIVISTAEGLDAEGEEHTWNFDIVQNNDIYIYVSKNKSYEETEMIKSITLNNFKTENGPQIGNMQIYRPSENRDLLYEYKDEYITNDKIVYNGSEASNLKNLEIANQGGAILFRLCNKNVRKIFI